MTQSIFMQKCICLALIGLVSLSVFSQETPNKKCCQQVDSLTKELNQALKDINSLEGVIGQQGADIQSLKGQLNRETDEGPKTTYRRKILPITSEEPEPSRLENSPSEYYNPTEFSNASAYKNAAEYYNSTEYSNQDADKEEENIENPSFVLRHEIQHKLSFSPSTLGRAVDVFGQTFHTFIVDLRAPQHELKMFWKNRQGKGYESIDAVRNKVQANGNSLAFATNGGIFDQHLAPKGLFIQNGEQLAKLDTFSNGYGNFYLMPNGVFSINERGEARIVPTKSFSQFNHTTIKSAIQSGPMLVVDGKYNDAFNEHSVNKRIRSGVGVIDDHRVVFAISKSETSFYDFARLFKEVFDCQNALYLDGTISKMYCPEMKLYDRGGEFSTIIGLVK